MNNPLQQPIKDIDPQETQEWLESLQAILEAEGPERAHFIIEQLIDSVRRSGVNLPHSSNTAYVNTIPAHLEEGIPGDVAMEHKIRTLIRWNAAAMVVRANRKSTELGGHIASFASASTLYDIGFNYFFNAGSHDKAGDLVLFQGHSAPGIYARAFLEGRLSEEQLENFRQEVDGNGLSSYPHPWLMPDFWQFPTVSMGLGPIQSIYQAKFMKYLHDRGLSDTKGRKVWAFLGDGEVDEPESLGAISLASREKLDNLIWVINCNLQRLDGPVRGNGKIIQELESVFRGVGWKVVKVIWGSYWDPLLAKDTDGLLKRRMMECVDGDFQNYKSKDGAYVREHFFGKYPELKAMVANMSDDDIWRLNRGGHDPHKVYAAYHEAYNTTDQPVVILTHTVKGYGMGSAGEGQMRTHSQKKLDEKEMIAYKNRFNIPINDEQAGRAEFYHPGKDSEEYQYMMKRREELGGFIPSRNRVASPLHIPKLDAFEPLLKSSGEREMSTTMSFVRLLTLLTRDKNMGKYVVPIVPDEARTFGMEGMFRQLGIYSSVGQLYTPQDKEQVMFYKEDHSGQILEEGINEAGSMSSWLAAATAYSSHNVNIVPFYIFYSIFGFQRVGDLAWLAGDIQARGFLMGATAGRTTLAGEGLQHQDGHSHIMAATIPNCVSYDPTFAYELAVIVQDGLRRMYKEQENVFYYITIMNENYPQPEMPKDVEEGIIQGIYLLQGGGKRRKKVQLMGSGTILREVIKAADILDKEWSIDADVWSVTSYNELTREAQDVDRWNRLHPLKEARTSVIEKTLKGHRGPFISATDYNRAYADQIRKWMPVRYEVLGTDGFGRSDVRSKLREYFEVNAENIVVAALKALADEGQFAAGKVDEAIKKYGIDPEKINPSKT